MGVVIACDEIVSFMKILLQVMKQDDAEDVDGPNTGCRVPTPTIRTALPKTNRWRVQGGERSGGGDRKQV